MPERTAQAEGWLRHAEVADHLRIDTRTLRGLMARTPDSAQRPWVNVGLGTRPQYRWESLAAASDWLKTLARQP